jgi:ABC-type amino acid transport substrate-binding protein
MVTDYTIGVCGALATHLKRKGDEDMKPRSTRKNLAALILLFALVMFAAGSIPGEAQTELPWRVVIKPLTPFVMQNGDNQYEGFSIDLWEEIARRLDHEFEYVWEDTVTDQLAAVKFGRGDVGITGISITQQREEMVDFSMPYFEAGLQILVSGNNAGSGWVTPAALMGQILSSSMFYRTLAFLALFIVIMGHAFWLLERRRNPDFQKPYLKGVWEGIWYTVVTFMTVGYGDRAAQTVPGRLLAMTWMFLSLMLIAGFTANITSQLTVSKFEGRIQGENDLPGKRIATVTGSTAARYLEEEGLVYTGVEGIEDAYALLEDGKVEAVVYDSPVLQYHTLNQGKGRTQVVGEVFQPQQYGIAYPTGSPNREIINQVLLAIIEDGTYSHIYQRWFGGS